MASQTGRMADLECYTSVRLLQRRALVYRDVIGPVALDFILRLFFARVVYIPFVVDVFCVHFNNLALTRPASEFHVT